jgi:IS5 family transposase
MKAHIAVDAESGLVHTVTTTPANATNVEQIADLLHGKEEQFWADSGYRSAAKRVKREDVQWHIAGRPSDIAKLSKGRVKTRIEKGEHRKASTQAKAEYPFRVIKRQFDFTKVWFKGLVKNTAHVMTVFALVNLSMARKKLISMMGEVRAKPALGCTSCTDRAARRSKYSAISRLAPRSLGASGVA